MSLKALQAKELFMQGFNCSQAVFGAFCEDFDISLETGLMLSGGFGGGFSRRREVCGAVSGAVMVLSLVYGFCDTSDATAKKRLYEAERDFMDEFEKETGSIICRELLRLEKSDFSATPEARTQEYYKKRPCAELVALAAELTERRLSKR